MIQKYLDQLAEIQSKAANYITELAQESQSGGVTYTTEEGKAKGDLIGLWGDAARVQHVAMAAGLIGKWYHYGASIAHIIMIKGEAIAEFKEGESKLLKAGDAIKVEPYQVLRPISSEASEALVVTIPAAKGYPGNTENE